MGTEIPKAYRPIRLTLMRCKYGVSHFLSDFMEVETKHFKKTNHIPESNNISSYCISLEDLHKIAETLKIHSATLL